MECKICHTEMDKTTAEVVTYKCKNDHGGTPPKIGAAVLACPLAKGAIWLHVIDDDGEDVKQEEIPASVLDVNKTTKAAFASWDPLDEKPHDVKIGTLPPEFWPLLDSTAENVPVRRGEITSVQFVLERVAQMNVIVREGENTESLADIKVEVARVLPKETVPPVTTLAGSGAKFPKLHKGDHRVKISLTTKEQQEKYWIDGDSEKGWDVKLHDLNKVVFTLRLVIWVEVIFRVKLVKEGKETELEKAKVKLKDPAEEKEAVLEEEKAVAKFKAKQAGREAKGPVEVLSLTPDATDALFEVVEIVTE